MQIIPSERRVQRSENPQQALTFQLQAICNRYGVAHIGIAEGEGLNVGGAAEEEHTDNLVAAYAQAIADSDLSAKPQLMRELLGLLPSDPSQNTVGVHSFEVDGHAMHVCGVGPEAQAVHAGLEHAVRGALRILQTL